MSQVGSHAAPDPRPGDRPHGPYAELRGDRADERGTREAASAPGSGESAADEEAAGGATHMLPGATGSGLRPCFAAGAQPDKEAWADGFAQVVVVTAAEEDFEAPEA